LKWEDLRYKRLKEEGRPDFFSGRGIAHSREKGTNDKKGDHEEIGKKKKGKLVELRCRGL